MNNRNRKLIIVIAAAALLFVIAILVIPLVQRIGKVEVNIVVAPSEATLTINDQLVNPGRHYLTPGEHTLKASLEYFADDVVTINTDSLPLDRTVYLIPKPESEEAFQWLLDNPETQQQREAAGGGEAIQQQEEITTGFPIVQNLPHESINYKIDHALTDNTLSFHITLYTYILKNHTAEYNQQLKDFKNEALQWLRDHDINPDDHDITYDPKEAEKL